MTAGSGPRTLSEILACTGPQGREAEVTIAGGRGGTLETRRVSRLRADASAAATRLQALGVGPGDRVVVALPTSWSWLEAWFGALLLGAWPMAVAPARRLGSPEAHVLRLEWLLRRFDARAVICSEPLLAAIRRQGARPLAERSISPRRLAATVAAPGWREHSADPDDVAYLQLTSGSTGEPRAVKVTHRNVLHNVAASNIALGRPASAPAHTWAGSYVSWLPLHHDMGLVGCLLNPLAHGLDLLLSDPASFLAQPRRWLEALGRRGPTIAAAPNQAYQWVLEKVDAGEGRLELAGWAAALVGAETVVPETMRAFAAAFARWGLDARVLRPCYGLAEATLTVTMDMRGEGVRTVHAPEAAGSDPPRPVVCIGEAMPDTQVRIVAPDGSVLGERSIGEIQVRGPAVTPGYFDDEAGTAEARSEGWLRTGDLGFVHDRELYFQGRLKELLIVGGLNLMPEEIERAADALMGAEGRRSAAFSVTRPGHGEGAVLVVESEELDPPRAAALQRQVRLAVGRALGIGLLDLLFVRRGSIPRTSSGKLQRGVLREHYLRGRLGRRT